jgi:hypothetical protein
MTAVERSSLACSRCSSPTVVTKSLAGNDLCATCYWNREGRYLLAAVRAGVDSAGRSIRPPIPDECAIGVMRFVAPASTWPPGNGLMKCDTCGDEVVGHLLGWPCDRCVDRGLSWS